MAGNILRKETAELQNICAILFDVRCLLNSRVFESVMVLTSIKVLKIKNHTNCD